MIYMPFFYGFDITSSVLYLLSIVIVLLAQSAVHTAYQKYKNMKNDKRISGASVARFILDQNGLQNTRVEVSNRGILSDYFDPVHNIIFLSNDVFYQTSIAAISIAAHECGHALQQKDKYGFLSIRNRLLPFANIASQLGWFIILVGLLLFSQTTYLLYTGIALLFIVALFQIVTLPLEFNASSRGIHLLNEYNFMIEEERPHVKKMLRAAAFTYVASLVATLANIVRILLLSRNRRNH